MKIGLFKRFIRTDTIFAFCLIQGFTLSFVGQLDGTAWTVEIFDFSTAVNTWITAGPLAGSEYRGVFAAENLPRTIAEIPSVEMFNDSDTLFFRYAALL